LIGAAGCPRRRARVGFASADDRLARGIVTVSVSGHGRGAGATGNCLNCKNRPALAFLIAAD